MNPQGQGEGLEVRGWSVGWGGELLQGPLDLTVHGGERIALIGPSGSGKSTLLKSWAGLLDPMAGALFLDGKSPDDWGWPAFRSQVHYLAQRPSLGLERVIDALRRPFSFESQRGAYDGAAAASALEQLGLDASILERRAGELSEGQAQRVAIARSLLLHPRFLLMDEPTSALDGESAERVERLIERRCTESGLAVVWVTHDRGQAERLGERTLSLQEPV